MSYPVPNTDLAALDGAVDAIREDGYNLEKADIGVVGGTLYGHVLQDRFPDAEVSVVESNPATAVTQAYAADALDRDLSPAAVRDRLYLSPVTGEAPEGWTMSPGGEALTLPEETYDQHRAELDDFLDRSTQFASDDATAVYAPRNHPVTGRNMYGVGDIGLDDGEVQIDMYSVTHQRDIYPHVLDEIDADAGVREPADIHVGDVAELEDGAFDVLLTNNVVDWFDDPDAFFETMHRIGADDGYHLELYSMPRASGSSRLDDPATVRRHVPAEDVRVSGHTEEGTLHSLGEYVTAFDGTYDTDSIRGGENGFVVHVEGSRGPVTGD